MGKLPSVPGACNQVIYLHQNLLRQEFAHLNMKITELRAMTSCTAITTLLILYHQFRRLTQLKSLGTYERFNWFYRTRI